ncbi:MAG TPA: MIP/aquaporin family protein [Nocardioidaceae bacterium]|nr:MIP/aquaporin family protein [Nocardioidaceae bacterium]
MGLGEIFLSEFLGTATLTLFGCGVVANVLLGKSKGYDGGWLLITFGWGFAVMSGVFVAFSTGAHINPAVTLGLLANGVPEYAPGVDVTVGTTLTYLVAEFTGAFLGGVLCWAAYRQHFDQPEAPPEAKLGVFSTGPQIRNAMWNLATEIIGTFALVFIILAYGVAAAVDPPTPAALSGITVGLLVVGIGASLGGPTGYAINPARDLGPRVAHAVLPIKGKGSSDWGYSWVPIVGPIVGGVLAGLAARGMY